MSKYYISVYKYPQGVYFIKNQKIFKNSISLLMTLIIAPVFATEDTICNPTDGVNYLNTIKSPENIKVLVDNNDTTIISEKKQLLNNTLTLLIGNIHMI